MASPAATPDAGALAPERLDEAVVALERGELVLLPTETVYGVAARADKPEALAALGRLSGRPSPGGYTVHIARPADVSWYIDADRPGVRRVATKLLPGPVTLRAKAEASRLAETGAVVAAVSRDGWVALRCPSDPFAHALLSRAGAAPVVAIGARDARGAGAARLDAVEPSVRDAVSVAVDGGATRFGKPSTVVELDPDHPGQPWRVVRPGVYDKRYLRKLMVFEVLLVCTGNTCRSPMAEAIARDRLAARFGVAPAELEASGYRVNSAGVSAGPGSPMTPEAAEALRGMG
ncbi:MAG: Sua5/YciO/YrdC/YwlC family protein, partial [Planctomycetota bacterium]